MNRIIIVVILLCIFSGCSTAQYEYEEEERSVGYEWAEENDIDDFSDCDDQFGVGDAEDGCNDYVKDNYTGYKTYKEYECTEDCSGHVAGYEWAEKKGIANPEDCGGNSQSFIEGCRSYASGH